MEVCYQCFTQAGLDKRVNPFLTTWDFIPRDETVRRKCNQCDLEGFYVREGLQLDPTKLPGYKPPKVIKIEKEIFEDFDEDEEEGGE